LGLFGRSGKKDVIKEKKKDTKKKDDKKNGLFGRIFNRDQTSAQGHDSEDNNDGFSENVEKHVIDSEDPYQIIGVSKNDSFEKISQVYKKLQKEYLEIDLRNKTAEERRSVNTALIKINRSYDKIRGSNHVNQRSQNSLGTVDSRSIKFHSEEERILKSLDPFQILNVSPNSTKDEIHRNYKKLQLKYNLTGMINKPKNEVQRIESLLKRINWAYTEIKKIGA